MSDHSERIYEFGDFRLDVGEAELRRDGTPVALSNKAVEMLNLLIERRSHTVTKDELMSTLWQDTFVDENNLAVTVSNLRKALGVPANDKQFIETVQRRGYRWTADVKETSGNGDTLIVERHSQTRITIQETAEKQSQAVGELERKVGRRSKQFLAITVFVIGLTGALAYAFWNNRNRAGENPGTQNQVSSANAPHSIAVLPFKNVTAENADDPLSIGLTDALISRLGNVKNLAVRPTSAVLQFVGASAMPQTVGEKLNVENVLSGTIQRDGEKIRVSIQLMNTTDGTILWAKKFDESFADVFKIQDLMSGEIADALRLEMPDTERTRLTERPTTDAEAFKLYIRGRYAWNKRTPESLTESIRQFNAAIDRDPTFALAYAALADSYALLSEYNAAPPVETFPKAKAAANRALEIDPNSAEAHTTLAYALASYDWNFNAAEREYKRALELKPNYATAHQWFGEMLFGLQRFEEADIELARAAVLDPNYHRS